jgi:hypothetical protein
LRIEGDIVARVERSDTRDAHPRFPGYRLRLDPGYVDGMRGRPGLRFASPRLRQVELVNFRPTMPPTISPMQASRGQSDDSANSTMPSSAVPTAPMPVQTA